MDKINRKLKTLERWEEILLPNEFQGLLDSGHVEPWEVLSPGEVLDIIVDWDGGFTTGHQVRSLISRVYGVEL